MSRKKGDVFEKVFGSEVELSSATKEVDKVVRSSDTGYEVFLPAVRCSVGVAAVGVKQCSDGNFEEDSAVICDPTYNSQGMGALTILEPDFLSLQ